MDLTHLHLLITHLPIYGSILGGFVLAYGLWTNSTHTMIAAYLLFIISAIGAGIAYSTGEAAEETVESIRSVAEAKIDPHEDFAIYALWAFILLGATSIIGLLFTWKKWAGSKTMGFVLLFMTFISFGLVAYTGYLGGQIRHTETSNSIPPTSTQYQQDEDDD